MRALFIVNILLLVSGPLAIILLILTKHLVTARELVAHIRTRSSTRNERLWTSVWSTFKELGWFQLLWSRAKFWVALLIALVLEALLVLGYVNLNPFVSLPASNWIRNI